MSPELLIVQAGWFRQLASYRLLVCLHACVDQMVNVTTAFQPTVMSTPTSGHTHSHARYQVRVHTHAVPFPKYPLASYLVVYL